VELVLETLVLEEGKGAIFLVELWIEGLMHTEMRSPKLDHPQRGVSRFHLNLFPLEVEM
jgi:hypothetical protein